MANNIATFKTYINLLDEVYKSASTSSDLDTTNPLITQNSLTGEYLIPVMDLDGLGDYSRQDGYVEGNATLSFNSVKPDYDRGRKFAVDAMDNTETAGLAFGSLSSKFIREKVVPEIDAYRYAKYAGLTGIHKVDTPATLTTGEQVLSALVATKNVLDEDEVATENRLLKITPTLLTLAQSVDTTKSKAILDAFTVSTVPQTRFYTAIDLKDGKTTGEETGGFVKNASAKDINFMVIQKDAILQKSNHVVNKIIDPETNQKSDSWLFFYRAYALCAAYAKKTNGIYLHNKA